MFSAKFCDFIGAAYKLGCFRQSRQKPVGRGKPVAFWDCLRVGKQRVRVQQIINAGENEIDTSKSFDLLESQQKGFLSLVFNCLVRIINENIELTRTLPYLLKQLPNIINLAKVSWQRQRFTSLRCNCLDDLFCLLFTARGINFSS